MAEEKKSQSKADEEAKAEKAAKAESKPKTPAAAKAEPKAQAPPAAKAKVAEKAAATAGDAKEKPKAETPKAGAKKDSKSSAKKEDEAKAPKAGAKKSAKKADDKDDDVTIVEEGEEAPKAKHTPRIKPDLDDATRAALAKRRTEDRRRPAFRRQQWFEFKRLARSGWRKPTGQDSAMRRHFGYRPPVVRVGYRGPAAARGLHPSGFEEVRVENVADLERIDPKKQAARVSGSVGRRKLKAIYETAEKKKIRILNRRSM